MASIKDLDKLDDLILIKLMEGIVELRKEHE